MLRNPISKVLEKLRARDGGASARRGWTLLEVMMAMVVVGLGAVLFMRVQEMTRRGSASISKQLLAGKMIEKYLEDARIAVAKDTLENWKPKSRVIAGSPPYHITLKSTITDAFSPKTGRKVENVARMDIVCYWIVPQVDSLKVTTYVARRF